jgi:hypothetical protein
VRIERSSGGPFCGLRLPVVLQRIHPVVGCLEQVSYRVVASCALGIFGKCARSNAGARGNHDAPFDVHWLMEGGGDGRLQWDRISRRDEGYRRLQDAQVNH